MVGATLLLASQTLVYALYKTEVGKVNKYTDYPLLIIAVVGG